MHNKTLLFKEIDKLKQKLLLLGGKVEENFSIAIKAIENKDMEIAQALIESDVEIDELEVEIEEDCLKILALYQPVAKDLRFIITALKVNNDLERIADHCVNIAKHAQFFIGKPLFKFPFDFINISTITKQMLKGSLDSLVELDHSKALDIRKKDDLVDEINKNMYTDAQKRYEERIDQVEMIMHSVGLCRCFERIADLSTNIAEDVIYLISGQIVRH